MYEHSEDWEHLMQQAMETAESYLCQARIAIDNEFGPNYAKTHPELVIAFMEACARDYETAAETVRRRAEVYAELKAIETHREMHNDYD